MAIDANLPVLRSCDYYTEPSICELAERELADPGYCSRIPNFVVGRAGYGHIRFIGETDVRAVNLDDIVKFDRHSVAVYENEHEKPPIGQSLNKTSEVTLVLQLRCVDKNSNLVNRLRDCTSRQGARFLSFEESSGEWKFSVDHFSRFGLVEEEEEDAEMDEVPAAPEVERTVAEMKDSPMNSYEPELSRSLPAHLGLSPARLREMRMLMFSNQDDDEDMDGSFASDHRYLSRQNMMADSPTSSARGSALRSPLHGSSHKSSRKRGLVTVKEPQALLEYNVNSEISPSNGILMTGQNKGVPLRMSKVQGFKLPAEHTSPINGRTYSNCIVDAALFMGRSFRVGWGPNGILVHAGSPVSSPGSGLSSVVNIEKVAGDKVVRDEANQVKDELLDLCFSAPMSLHRSLDREFLEIEAGSSKLVLQRVVASRTVLPDICRAYIDILERQLEVSDLSVSSRVFFMHQVTVWELIRVLFSEREAGSQLKFADDDDQEAMVLDKKDGSVDIDQEALTLMRRAEFSNWLQESVCHRVQGEVSSLNDARYLEHILLLLTGRQLDEATELAALRGDVRLAILLSQAGGSMVNRSDVAQQLDLWKINGLDLNLIEEDRLKIYELLAGNIEGALQDSSIDWKRYIGLIMWYQLSPDTSLDVLVHTYQQLLSLGRVPYPVPVYIDEGPLDEAVEWTPGDRFDISFYLMLLHANEDQTFGQLKVMFSALSSSNDTLDYHMIWHQRSILEAIDAFSSNDLHLLDMSFVHQLLCTRQYHWAIYVIIHMPFLDDAPYFHEKLIKEILSRYCESWSTEETQKQFIEELGVPAAWMHEALAVYYEYYGDRQKALEHYIQCGNWHKAHMIFFTSVAHSLFLSSKHTEIWNISSSLEEHKTEIADWDLGAGIYIDFYTLRSSMQEETTMSDSDPLEKKSEDCRNFFCRLNDSLLIWGSKISVEARASFSKMAEELSDHLVTTPGASSTANVQMGCFETVLSAPVPEDLRATHLQNAVSVFAYLISSEAN